MSAEFEKAIGFILEHEGGLSRDKNDRGGVTNYGITLPILREMGMAGDLNHDGYIDEKDIIGLTVGGAQEIYRARWWERFGYGTLPTQALANKTFDECVNFGWFQGHVNLQRALNMLDPRPFPELKLDGWIGPRTFDACAKSCEGGLEIKLVNNLRAAMAYVYGQIVAKDPSQLDFALGWLRRAAW